MARLACVAALLASSARAQQLKPCPPTVNASGHANCLSDESCCVEQYFGASGCLVQTAVGKVCCAPGPALPISATLKNVLIIGDSVSDQYTPSVAQKLASSALVQHSPWVGGGSANDVANGLFNLKYCRWLRTALRPDQAVPWDLVTFNFGLHDLQNVFPASLAVYTATLANVTDLLLASGAKKIMYIATTPFEADELPACGPYCNAPNSSGGGVGDWPQPTNGGNGRCGPPQCEAGSLGCGTPNATAKAQ